MVVEPLFNLYKQHPQSSMSQANCTNWTVSLAICSVSPALSILAADQDNRQFLFVYKKSLKKSHGFVASKTRKCESCIDVKPTSFTEGGAKKNPAGLRAAAPEMS